MCSSLIYSETYTHAKKSLTNVVRLEQTQVRLRHIYGFKSLLYVSKTHLQVCKSHCMCSSLTYSETYTHLRKTRTHVVRLEHTQVRLRHIYGSKSHLYVSKSHLRVCKSHFMCSSLTYSETYTHARKSWTHVVRLEQTQMRLRHIHGSKSN
jgi:hypothetical protein